MSDDDQGRAAFTLVHEKMVDDLTRFYWDAFTALNINGISGDYVEFGSAGGTSLRLAHGVIHRTPVRRHMWAFDSFAGLPEPATPLDVHPAFAPGFGQGGLEGFVSLCEAASIPADDYTAVDGFFDDTLPALGEGPPRDIALAYVDCNMYSSTVSVLEFLTPRLKHGMVLAFDDYFCWSPTEVSGERAAFDELMTSHPEWAFLRFKDPTWGGASFVVERVAPDSPRRRP